MTPANDNTVAADLLTGGDEIAAFLGMARSAVYYSIRQGALPTFRIGKNVFARKSTLLGWIAGQERATA